MVDLYEKEKDLVVETVQKIQSKYWGKTASGENLLRLQNEIVGRLEDIGFQVTVDVTPVLEGDPVTVRIDRRLDDKPFDSERKRWEVKRRITEKKQNPDDIEGMV